MNVAAALAHILDAPKRSEPSELSEPVGKTKASPVPNASEPLGTVGTNAAASTARQIDETRQPRGFVPASASVPTVPSLDALEQARALGWRVIIRPAGLLVDTCGHAIDADLLDSLHALVTRAAPAAWPKALLDDPGEITLRGVLAGIEEEFD